MVIVAQAIPGAKEAVDTAEWLSRQQLSVWFAMLVLLAGWLLYLIIKHLMKVNVEQRASHVQSVKEERESYSNQLRDLRAEYRQLQIEEKAHSSRLLEYLEKDHGRTVILLQENQTIMSEVVSLLREIKQDRHDDGLLRKQNNELLNRVDRHTTPVETK